MIRPEPGQRGYRAFIAHRVSGLALALFLPLHFLALGLALESNAALNHLLKAADVPTIKLAAWGLVVLLGVHFMTGLRVMALELVPWKGRPKGLMGAGALGVAAVVVVLFSQFD